MKKRQRYSPEFKAQAIDLLATGKPVQEILKKAAVILGTKVQSGSGK